MIYSADIEATTEEPVTPYLLGFCSIYDYKITYATDTSSFIDRMLECGDGAMFYFHNLKYDYSILFTHMPKNVVLEEEINGKIRKIRRIYITRDKVTIELRDSSPQFSPAFLKLDTITASWCNIYRKDKNPQEFYEHYPNAIPLNHKKYFDLDLLSLAEAIFNRYQVHLTAPALTASGQAFKICRKLLNERYTHNKNFFSNVAFPKIPLDVDKQLRPYYSGGYTYLNEDFKDSIIDNVKVYDVNSMYPYVMATCNLPYSRPLPFKKKPPKDRLFVVKISVLSLSIKEGWLPWLPEKSTFEAKSFIEFLIPSDPEELRTFYLTSVEYELLLDSYEVEGIRFLGGFSFKSCNKFFEDYINVFMSMKMENKGAKREFAKLMLNAPSGKFGQSPENVQYKSVLEDGMQKFEIVSADDSGTNLYLPVSIFTTAHARVMIARTINSIGSENFIYCDTDSIHTVGRMDDSLIHPVNMGFWKLEKVFDHAKYLRAKRYAGILNDKISFTVAGIKESDLLRVINRLEDFKEGVKIPTKKMRYCKGGQRMINMIVTV